jgi:hypothetical protein
MRRVLSGFGRSYALSSRVRRLGGVLALVRELQWEDRSGASAAEDPMLRISRKSTPKRLGLSAERTIVRIVAGLVSLGTLLATGGCSDEEEAGAEPAPEPHYDVGTATYELVDASREEALTPEPGDVREVRLRVWYPARAAGVPAAYFPNALEGRLNAENAGLPEATFAALETRAFEGAPVADAASAFPVLVFSPGMSTNPSFYSHTLRELASRGYVVFALAHSHATGSVVLSDGRVLSELAEPRPSETRDASILEWSLDQRFVLDRAAALDAQGSGDRFEGRLDLARAGALGHSRGGAAAAQACASDARFKACANLDGSVSAPMLVSPPAQPFLLVRSELEESTLDTFFAGLRGSAHRVRLEGANHNDFTDLGFIVDGLSTQGIELDRAGLLLGSIEPERASSIVGDYVAAFFDAELRGRQTVLFESSAEYPEVSVANK